MRATISEWSYNKDKDNIKLTLEQFMRAKEVKKVLPEGAITGMKTQAKVIDEKAKSISKKGEKRTMREQLFRKAQLGGTDMTPEEITRASKSKSGKKALSLWLKAQKHKGKAKVQVKKETKGKEKTAEKIFTRYAKKTFPKANIGDVIKKFMTGYVRDPGIFDEAQKTKSENEPGFVKFMQGPKDMSEVGDVVKGVAEAVPGSENKDIIRPPPPTQPLGLGKETPQATAEQVKPDRKFTPADEMNQAIASKLGGMRDNSVITGIQGYAAEIGGSLKLDPVAQQQLTADLMHIANLGKVVANSTGCSYKLVEVGCPGK